MKDTVNLKQLELWCKGRLECEWQWASLDEQEMLKLVVELIHELEEYRLKTCPECKLEYHERDCVVDGQQTGERYKVAVCKQCGYERDIE